MTPSDPSLRAADALERVRSRRPLIHHLTNWVVMNDTANLTLALGASPVMAHAEEEVAELAAQASAVVLNPGTLDGSWIDAMTVAGRAARDSGTPVVLDPVGAGATAYRTSTNLRFLDELRPTVVRGNGGEIGSLIGAGGEVRGVDAVEPPEDPAGVARQAARSWGAAVAVTGPVDHVADRRRLYRVEGGHPLLEAVTGTGCMATTAVACFVAVEDDAAFAAAAALACYALAAETAAATAAGPGSFRTALLDAVWALTPERVREGALIEERPA